MIAGAARMLAENGFAKLTVNQITAYAGVSRTTFYKNFRNRQDCVMAAHEEIFARLVSCMSAACSSETDWKCKVSASIQASLAYMAMQPDDALVLVLDSRTTDAGLAKRTAAAQKQLAKLLHANRQPSGHSPPPLTELASIGAISAVISNHLIAGEAGRLQELAPQLIYLTLLPYVDSAEAERAANAASSGLPLK